MTLPSVANRTIRWRTVLSVLLVSSVGLALTDAAMHLVIGSNISVEFVLVQIATIACMWTALWVPQPIMDQLRKRLPMLTEGEQLDRKSAYIKLMVVAAIAAVILLVASALIVSTLVHQHRFMLAFAAVAFWAALDAVGVLLWAYKNCPS